MKSYDIIVRMLDKMNRRMLLDRFIHKNDYFFNNGQTVQMIDISKDIINYTVIKLKLDINKSNFAIFVMIRFQKKIINHMLFRFFVNEKSSSLYMKNLETFIRNASNEEIIKRCYSQLPSYISIIKHKENRLWERF